jgi:hypothetical protein
MGRLVISLFSTVRPICAFSVLTAASGGCHFDRLADEADIELGIDSGRSVNLQYYTFL